LLCSATVPVFGLNDNRWYEVAMDDLTDPKWEDDAWDDLVMPSGEDDTKEFLFDLAKMHSEPVAASHKITLRGDIDEPKPTLKKRQTRIGDVVEKKGAGLVILMYGPSGVGKTLTAGKSINGFRVSEIKTHIFFQ
jgi:flagellar biosynthesis GTPase FlhF